MIEWIVFVFRRTGEWIEQLGGRGISYVPGR